MKKLSLLAAALSALTLAACGTVQPPECAQWIECQAAVDALAGTNTADSYEASYGADGTCWDGNEATATSCADACVRGRVSLRQSYPDVAACDPDRSEG
jgi:hypothetical protein